MDNEEKTHDSFVSSSSPGNVDGIERQRPVTSTPIRKAWATVATLVKMKCSATFYTLATLVKMICSATFNTLGFTLGIPLVIIAGILVLLPLLLINLGVLQWRKWKGVFILSCVAVSVDTLFLYIPIIDDKNKCLGMDKTLRNVALVFRSLTDFAFILHIIFLIFGNMDEGLKWNDSNSDFDVPASTYKSSLVNHILQHLKPVAEAIAEKMPWLSISIIINCLAILPIPQIKEYFS